ncbi:DUF559 domain-containing protein [Frankia sp. R82]|uniref:DUF559 domain-containing protein n=1 Tax=Frankia sp. R82 TaxID=2950553 RepID=UPI0020443D6B|nr:DUF559 domain-containing protein [Frankia sp. R82]MCM3886794.1 endonuclease domain-containing protein [Frankia sp. R82]
MTADWDALLRTQSMIFTLHQAYAHGFTDHQVRWRVGSDRWQRIHPQIFAAHNGPLSYADRTWAAVLYAGEGAVLSHGTAAHAWGLATVPPRTIHVVVTSTHRRSAASDVRIHRATELTRREIFHPDDAPPRTSVERTVLDLVGQADKAVDAGAIIARAIQHGRTSAPRLTAALDHRVRLRHARMARDYIALTGKGAQSVLELQHARTHRRHALPLPVRQHRHDRPDGRWYLDAVYLDYNVAVELDGRSIHTQADRWWADMDRDNQLQTDGYLVLRFAGFVVLSDPCRMAADIANALHARGWPGPFRRCPRCPARSDRIAPSPGLAPEHPHRRTASRHSASGHSAGRSERTGNRHPTNHGRSARP